MLMMGNNRVKSLIDKISEMEDKKPMNMVLLYQAYFREKDRADRLEKEVVLIRGRISAIKDLLCQKKA